jgi:hypothetical protein
MSNSMRLFAFVVIAGALCGGALVATTIATRNGWMMLLPYIALGLVSAIFLRGRRIESFGQRFIPPFAAYAVATVIIDAYILTVANPPRMNGMTLSRFFGPLLAMLLIGAAGSLVVAVAARQPSARDGELHANAGI